MRPKSLPSQFGQKCDIKEAGNKYSSDCSSIVPADSWWTRFPEMS